MAKNIPILFLLVIVGLLSFLVGKENITLKGVQQNLTISLKTINLGGSSVPYFAAQLKSPSNYFATDDSMLSAYDSQGGAAPPRLILTKNRQVFADEKYFELGRQDDCVIVMSTMGFPSPDAWTGSSVVPAGNLIQNEIVNVGKRQAIIYTQATTKENVFTNQGNIFVGFLNIGNKEGTSYYFYTCNANNKTDFINVIKSIKFRDDLNFNG